MMGYCGGTCHDGIVGETFHVLVGLSSMFPFCHDGIEGETFHTPVGLSSMFPFCHDGIVGETLIIIIIIMNT